MPFPLNRYVRIHVDGRQTYEHRYVWAQAHGPIPIGCHIHHVDGNPRNNALVNLACVSHGTHNKLHHTTVAVKCADPGCRHIARKRGYCETHYVRYCRREKHNAAAREYHRRRRAARTPEQVIADRMARRKGHHGV